MISEQLPGSIGDTGYHVIFFFCSQYCNTAELKQYLSEVQRLAILKVLSVLVRVSTAVKRRHDDGSIYKGNI